MKRRDALVAAAAWSCGAVAQPAPHRIGFLTHNSRDIGQQPIDTFVAQMRVRGWEAGRDFVIEPRFGDGDREVMAARARELAALGLPVLVAAASPSAEALWKATRSIPIVGFGLTMPVEVGLAQSYARPGGNVTGSTFNQPSFAGKVMEMLKVAAPQVTRVTVVYNPSYLGMSAYQRQAARVADELRLQVQYVEVTRTENFRIEDVERSKPEALYVSPEYAINPLLVRIAAFAMDRRLPSIGTNRTFVVAGGLMSLDSDPGDMFGVAADYVIRILSQGANPATLPIQEPTRYHLVFNRRTADAIGFTMSQRLMLSVKEVIG